jgi:phosphonate degradation associated HDIG domain protein
MAAMLGGTDDRTVTGRAGAGPVIALSRTQGSLRQMDLQAIHDLYATQGHLAYEGEGVSQLQHAWQCGRLARHAGAAPALQLAAWLHDLGHLMSDHEGSPTLRGIDDRHEATAAAVLLPLFGPRVSEPLGLHVEAKRCLVATKPEYLKMLSPDSLRSLALQGGPMAIDAARTFLQRPGAAAAMRLRMWDDVAKSPGLQPPSTQAALESLRGLMQVVAEQAQAGAAAGARPS